MKNNPLVIFCCFLPLNEQNKNLWNKINRLLKEKKIDFILLTSSQGYDELEFPVINIPFSLKGFAELFNFEGINHIPSDEELQLIKRDINWINDSIDELENYINGYYACRLFYHSLIKILKPKFVFVWGHYLSQSIIFKKILEAYCIPVHCLERGFYSSSLMIEDLLYSEINKLQLNKSKSHLYEQYNAIKNFYNDKYQSKYPENHNLELENFLIEKKANGYKIITLLGSHDVPLFPRDNNLSKELSPIFQSTLEAAFKFFEVLSRFNDIIFIIKPHPNDLLDYSILNNKNVVITKNFYNKRLFEISDVFIVGNTTLQFEAIFYEKPIILYAKSALKFSEGVYLLENMNEIENVLMAAINKIKLDEKIEGLKLSLINILNSHIYFYENISSFKDFTDFISFIESKIIRDLDEQTINERLNDFETLIVSKKNINHLKNINNLSLIYYPNSKNFENEIIELKEIIKKELKRFYFLEEYSPLYNLLYKAEEFIKKGNLSEARQILTHLLSVNPFDVNALNDMAVVDILESKYSNAAQNLKKVLNIFPKDEIAIENLNYIIENHLIDNKEELNSVLRLFKVPIQINKISSFNNFIEYKQRVKDILKERFSFENKLLPSDNKEFYYNGFCIVCDKILPLYVDFWNAYNFNGQQIPNWRERLVCPSCGLNNRMRLTYHFIKELYPNFSESSVYITEQTTTLFRILKKLNPGLIGSEFLGDETTLGGFNNSGIRNEDFTKLSFHNAQFDLVISLEVLEHIPNYHSAVKEALRALKPNGKFLFTVPFNRDSQNNIVRAKLNDDGSVTHLLSPEYHGDPLNKTQGCLCYYHFGWELLDELRQYGFKEAYALSTYSKEYGYLGVEQLFFVAEKGD